MMNKRLLFLLLTLIGLSGCEQAPSGFSLPAGDVANGEKIFVSMQCLACHTMKGFERPESAKESDISVALGGEVSQVKTYADLVTSVINPSHKLAKGYDLSTIQREDDSLMPVYNDVLTVSQLVDLVSFLESRYEIRPYNRSDYGPIYDPYE